MENTAINEVWEVFDLVKVNLTDILVKGVEGGGGAASFVPALASLKNRLAAINMGVIADLVQALIEALGRAPSICIAERRSSIASIMMKIMTAARLFEVQLNKETLKQRLVDAGGAP
ncbi:MAG: hypothetical protein GYA24_09275 [Candidatus Lokiarchaeota archaeon]|nr:hypothetical protein [Candidatus Lokiarchaeota archaeon]